MVRRSASGFKVRKCERSKIGPKFREEFTHRETFMEYVRVVWRRFLADGTDVKSIPTLEKQGALTRPANSITNVAAADNGVERAP